MNGGHREREPGNRVGCQARSRQEHIVGGEWPEAPVRLERMVESVEIIKQLFTGKKVRHSGKHLKMESARLYTRPEKPLPLYIAASGVLMERGLFLTGTDKPPSVLLNM